MKELLTQVKATRGFSPSTTTNVNTAFVTQIIDTAGYESLLFLIAIGALTDANVTFALTLEHGDDPALSDTAAPAATDLVGTAALATWLFSDDDKVAKIGYKGKKRYVRLTVTPAGNDAGSISLSCIALLAHARNTTGLGTQLGA